MKLKMAARLLAIFPALLALPALAQANADASVGLAGCGPVKIKFEVKTSTGKSPAQPEPGKALVFFIERDINTNLVTHTSRADVDGQPMGAAYGDSYFYFSVDPGVHHLCATTQFGLSSEDIATAVLHFTAEAGGVYYFEMKNISWPERDVHDASLFPLDSDEGKYLEFTLPLVSSKLKK
jgi:hypothetical protein